MFGFKRDREFEESAQRSFAFIRAGAAPAVRDSIYSPESFGNAALTLRGDFVQLRVTRDRSQILVDVAPRWCDEWYDEDLVLQLVGATDDARVLAGARSSMDVAAESLERNLAEIIDRFSKSRWDDTKADLQALARLRAFQEFGVVPPRE